MTPTWIKEKLYSTLMIEIVAELESSKCETINI